MLKLYIILVLILCCSANLLAEQIIPYITVGIRIGWDFKCGRSISPRLSIGIAEIEKGAFINLTFGMRTFKKPIIYAEDFSFLDLQVGKAFEKIPVGFLGGGVGILFCRSNQGSVSIPRNTFFLGCFLFPSVDVTYWDSATTSYDIGVEAVLPIPLRKIDFGSPGG